MSINSKPIGYVIRELQSDKKKKQFISKYYNYIDINKKIQIESLTAVSSLKLKPLNFQLTHIEKNKSYALDGVIQNQQLTLKTIRKMNPTVKNIKLRKDIFFSSFLAQTILNHPKGIAVGHKYEYDAIAEEDGLQYKGVAWVQEQNNGIYKILNTFKNDKYINWMNSFGETIKISVPKNGIVAELVLSPKEALQSYPYSKKNITEIFGHIPAGTQHHHKTK